MPGPRRNKQSQPASAPYPPRPPPQAPPPPENPNCNCLPLQILELYERNRTLALSALSANSHENRALVDAVRNRNIAPAVAIANAEARALAKGNVKGPSGQSSGIAAAPPAVKTASSVPPPLVPAEFPLDPLPSTPRAPSPSASVLSKRSQRSGSSSSGPSVAAVLVCDNDDSSMALDYEAVTLRPGSPNELVDNKQTVNDFIHTIDSLLDILSLFTEADWRKDLLQDTPTLMDNELNDVYNHFKNGLQKLAPSIRPLLPAVEAPATAVDAPAPRVVPRNPQPPAESTKTKPPKKKSRVEPAPSDLTMTPPAPEPVRTKTGALPLQGLKRFEPKTSKRAPPPASAPTVSFAAPSAPRKASRRHRHTTHGASRRGIKVTPPPGLNVTAASFTPEVINDLNAHIK